MLTKRIIPCLDVHNGRVVKGLNFVNLRDARDPVKIAAYCIHIVGEASTDEMFDAYESKPFYSGSLATKSHVVLSRIFWNPPI